MARPETSTHHLTRRTTTQLALVASALTLFTASGASAQRIDAETFIEEDRIDGCSRSTASTHTETTLHLVVEATGVATLELQSSSRSAFRSATRSPGQPISTSGSVAGSLEANTWSGRASTGADGALSIRFDHLKTASIHWSGHGSLPLPSPRHESVQLDLRCVPTPLDVYPPAATGQVRYTAGASELSVPTAGYECTVSGGTAYLLSRLREIPFSKTTPIARFVSAMFSGERSLIRGR